MALHVGPRLGLPGLQTEGFAEFWEVGDDAVRDGFWSGAEFEAVTVDPGGVDSG